MPTENIFIADYSNTNQANAIINLMQLYAADPMGGGEGLSQFSCENMISGLDKIVGAFSVLAFVEDEPAGLINCIPGFSTFYSKPLINIHDAVVQEKFRGKKLIQRMLTIVELKAIETGCCKITLEVLDGNEMAKSAYRRFGFSDYTLDPKMGKALFWDKVL